jgi:MFS family permease
MQWWWAVSALCSMTNTHQQMAAPMHAVLLPLTRSPWELYSQRQRWGFLVILFLVATANYFDYFILSVLLEPIKQEFKVSDTKLGLLSGVCFALVYSAAALPTARWADRGNRRNVITWALCGWSIMTALCGFAHSFWQLAFARFGVGLSEPGALPAAQSLIADYFPPDRRATAVAILSNGGSAVGWLVGIGFGGYVASIYGWRMAFLLAGSFSLVLALITGWALAEPRLLPEFKGLGDPTERMSQSIFELCAKRSFVAALFGISLYSIFVYGVMVFVPSFLIRSYHASLTEVSIVWGSVIAIANILGAVIGGLLADRLSRWDIRWLAWIPAIGCACGLPLYALAFHAAHLWIFVGVEFLAELVLSIGAPIVFAFVLAVCGARRRAFACAATYCAMVLFGGNLGPLLVGAMSDALYALYGWESLRYSLLAILVFLVPSAVAFYWAGRSMLRDLED